MKTPVTKPEHAINSAAHICYQYLTRPLWMQFGPTTRVTMCRVVADFRGTKCPGKKAFQRALCYCGPVGSRGNHSPWPGTEECGVWDVRRGLRHCSCGPEKMKEPVLSVAFAVLSVAGYRRVSAGSLHAAMRICLQAPFPHRQRRRPC